MKKIILGIFLVSIIQLNLYSQNIYIDNLIDSLSDKRIIIKELKGEFNFYKSDYESNIFKSEFLFENKKDETFLKILYSSIGSEDLITINKNSYKLKTPYDVTSCKIYNLNYKGREMLCLLGKSASASGSGVQLTFYTLFYKVRGTYALESEFSTRFGSIYNLGDFNDDGRIELISIKRDSKNFKLFVSNFKGEDLEMGIMQLDYNGNNEFTIENNQLSLPANRSL